MLGALAMLGCKARAAKGAGIEISPEASCVTVLYCFKVRDA
jgi:hypothetical protein